MEIQSIRTFIDVVRQGSFAGAARQRDLDPSTVSRAISVLEAELGFSLFHRTTRRLTLTEAGERYHTRVQGVVEALEGAGAEARDLAAGPAGTLRVTACTSFGERVLAPLLADFLDAYPELEVELLLADHQVDLIEQQIDVAIRFGLQPAADAAAALLMPRRFHVCASRRLLERIAVPSSPEALRDAECLVFSTPGYRGIWRFRRRGKVLEVPVRGRLRVSHGLTMTRCVMAGLGIGMLPDWLCRAEIDDGALCDLFPEYECTATEFDTAAWVVYPNRHYRPLKVDVFVEYLRCRLSAGPAPESADAVAGQPSASSSSRSAAMRSRAGNGRSPTGPCPAHIAE